MLNICWIGSRFILKFPNSTLLKHAKTHLHATYTYKTALDVLNFHMCSLLHTRFPFAMAFIFIVLVSVGLAYGESNYFDNATADNLTLAAYNISIPAIGKFLQILPMSCPHFLPSIGWKYFQNCQRRLISYI